MEFTKRIFRGKPDPAKITPPSRDAPPRLSLSRDEPPPKSRLDYTPTKFVPPEEQQRPSNRKIKKKEQEQTLKKDQEPALKKREQERALKKEHEQSRRTSQAFYRLEKSGSSNHSSKHQGTFYEDEDEARGNEGSRRKSRNLKDSLEEKRPPGWDSPPDLEPNQTQKKGSPLHTVEQLCESYESFKGYMLEKCPEAVEYVEALKSQSQQLTKECNSLVAERTDFKSHIDANLNDAWDVISRLHPESLNGLSQDRVPNIHQLISFLLRKHEMVCNDIQELHQRLHSKKAEYEVECRRLEAEVEGISKQISMWETHYDTEVRRITGKHTEALREKDRNVARLNAEHESALREKDRNMARLNAEHESALHEQKALLESENQRHDEEKRSLEAQYNADLHQQRVKLETDMTLLQQALLTTVDRFQPLEDSVLQFRFKNLKNAVGRIARTRLEVDSEGLARAFDQRSFIQMAEKKHHKFVLESTLWSILIQGFFSTPFRVLGDNGNSFAVTWSQLFQPHQNPNAAFGWPEPDELSEKWRYVTFETLRRGLDQFRTNKSVATEHVMRNYENNSSKVTNALYNTFSKVCSQDKRTDILAIVDEARSLALDFGIERCRLQIFAPQPKEYISRAASGAYDDINLDLTEGIVELVASPGLRKMGDGRGGRLDQVIDLCPAAVYLRAPSN